MGRIPDGDPEHGIATDGKELERSVNVCGLGEIEDNLKEIADELSKRNEIEARKLELLKQIEKNLSDKDKE